VPEIKPMKQAGRPAAGLHGEHQDADAGNEGHDGGESGNIAKNFGHLHFPFPLCFYFVPYLFSRQEKERKRNDFVERRVNRRTFARFPQGTVSPSRDRFGPCCDPRFSPHLPSEMASAGALKAAS
jgi:hypothetical protein